MPVIACEIGRRSAERLEHSPARRFITGAVIGENVIGLSGGCPADEARYQARALVAGTTPNDEYSAGIFREGLKAYAGRLDLIDLTKLPMRQTLERVDTLPPDTIVLYAGIIKDGAGQNFVPREALSLIARAASVPVFGLYDSFMGFGIVGAR